MSQSTPARADDSIQLTFWGVRGTLPVPGPRTVRYGGNTNCITLECDGDRLLVFDAGTGIKVLSDHMAAGGPSPKKIDILISHPHWDHINGLPFFAPLYNPDNDIRIDGPAHGAVGMRELIAGQMDGVYFPINIQTFGARVSFRDLQEGPFAVDGIEVAALRLNHPGHCLGYRVDYRGRSVCYLTDNELGPDGDRGYLGRVTRFVEGADALIADCTYTDEEYGAKIGWGHSGIGAVVDWAHAARVRCLYLYHHDPSQDDDAIDEKLAAARSRLADLQSETRCVAPAENQRFFL